MEDAEGGKYNLSLEGNISKNKVMKVFELMELLDVKGHNDGQGTYDNKEQHKDYSSSMGAKIWRIIEKKFQFRLVHFFGCFHDTIETSMVKHFN